MLTLQRNVDYKPQYELIVDHLENGVNIFSIFVRKLKESFNKQQDDIKYIKYQLLPQFKTAKQEFDAMKYCADNLLKQVNEDLERCVATVSSKNKELKSIVIKITQLQKNLDQSENEIRDAEKQCDRKRNELSDANSALSTDMNELSKAKESQEKTVVVGTATTIGSAVLSIVFPPALLGVAGGLATTTAGLTVFETAKKECENNVERARCEVSSSRSALDRAKENKESIKQQMSKTKLKLIKAENEKKKALEENDIIKDYQSRSIYINESIKFFHREICSLNGKISILSMETDGGYCLSMLKEPTNNVCNSLFSLLRCPALCDSCSPSKIQKLNRQLCGVENKSYLSVNVCKIFIALAVMAVSIIVFNYI